MFRKLLSRRDLPSCSKTYEVYISSVRYQHDRAQLSSASSLIEIPTPIKKPQIEMVPAKIHRHLFPSEVPEKRASDDSIQLELPKLRKESDLMGHFDAIGREQFESYEELLLSGLEMKNPPPFPKEWTMAVGWTKYDPETGFTTPVDFPNEDLLFFDVEVAVLDGQLPTMAIALSPTSWYSWCSDRLVNSSEVPRLYRLEHLIPLEPKNGSERPKIVVGHNVAYDRARVREQYYQKKTMTRFWDTMSMSIAVYGMADHQRIMYEASDINEGSKPAWIDAWRERVCKNGLGAVHQKLCGHTTILELEKSFQNFFVKEDINAIREKFQTLMQYCAEDVYATFEVFQALYPTFRQRFPHPITSVGMMEIASAYLPITSNWRKFYDKCEMISSLTNDKAAQKLAESIKDLCVQLEPEQKWIRDPWMWISDWTLNKRTHKPKWFMSMFSNSEKADDLNSITAKDIKQRCRDFVRVFGICYGQYPLFYKSAHGWGFLVHDKTMQPQNVPEIQSVKTKRGDEVILPSRAIFNLILANEENNAQSVVLPEKSHGKVGIFDFYKLPHKKDPKANVGSPFSKDYKDEFETKILWASRYEDSLMGLLDSQGMTRFWGNYRSRFNEQMTIWLDEDAEIGAIAPSVIPSGTVTRRSVHKLWMTSANPKEGLIGSDLKSMVQCTPGWKLVGADVDSQEQWIAAILGDSVYKKKTAGGTEFSEMLLSGSKTNKTDLHSVVAKEVGISRDSAKILNYARLYGSGESHAITFLRQQYAVKEDRAKEWTTKLFESTKGEKRKHLELNPEAVPYLEEFINDENNKDVVYPDLKDTKKRKKDEPAYIHMMGRYFLPCYSQQSIKETHITMRFENWMLKVLSANDRNTLKKWLYKDVDNKIDLYRSGIESYTFNYLELMLLESELKTPILQCRLSQALEPLPNDVPGAKEFLNTYKRSIINWCVQSSAVDFLHMLIVCMNWLCKEYDIRARFVLSIHDEIRYLVAEEDKYRCALAMTLTNMYVRAAISQKLGIEELPQSVAFFSQVDIDTVLRKEVNILCKTPDGQLVPPGEALTMAQIIEKTGGRLTNN